MNNFAGREAFEEEDSHLINRRERRHANTTSSSESSSPHLDESQEEALKADLSHPVRLSLQEQDLVPLSFWNDDSSPSVGISSPRLGRLAQHETRQSSYFETFQNSLGNCTIPEGGDPRRLHGNASVEVDPGLQKFLSSFEEPLGQYKVDNPSVAQLQQRGKQEKDDSMDTKVSCPYPRTRRSHAAAFPHAGSYGIDSETMGKPGSSSTTFQAPDMPASARFMRSMKDPPQSPSTDNDAQGPRRVSQTSNEEQDSTKTPSTGADSTSAEVRFREYQEDQWMENFAELQEFIKTTGRAFIPQDYPGKDSLARWAKRQVR